MKYTVGQIKQMLEEMDKEFPQVDENEQVADRAKKIQLMSGLVKVWLRRGYSYAHIAERLRIKGFIQISEKALKQVSMHSKRKQNVALSTISEKGKASVKNSITEKNVDAKQNGSTEDSLAKELEVHPH